ncbi:hypothetical protein [Actinokineospora spheciospongiae]|uniref:hypothetical protein n=1 Tax=Actinokineospora spheciospongiae TaxID=909613 RepID=UPI000D7122F5|nr:hypothetical protein [Actinokineospora spheciospongiae]PWW53141.1 hypothetical protein DFQ13_116131 [Actinokineospora spheciospongiae]
MAPDSLSSNTSFDVDSLPLDSVRAAFEWLVTGPRPLSIEGRHFPGLPRRRVPLDELRELLLGADLPMPTVDSVWVHLVTRSRDEGDAWTVACVGLALPALFAVAAGLCSRFADDHRDIHGAILTGFLAELAGMDLGKPWVLWRLRCAGLRAGHLAIRDALARPTPSDEDFHGEKPAPPWGHPDFVLARAVAAGAITGEEAELIGSTRLEDHTLTAAAAERGVGVTTLHWARSHAEARLLAWLTEQAPHDDPADRRDRDAQIRAVHSTTITTAADTAADPPPRPARLSPTVSKGGGKTLVTVRHRHWKKNPETGVEDREATAPTLTPTPASTPSPDHPTGTSRRSSSTTAEVPRCA